MAKRGGASEAKRLLGVVKLSADLGGRKPDRLSGGQKQRAAIARALAGDPDVIVADEPVSALDVSVQASIVNLLNEIQTAREATLIFISHDLSVVRYLADHVAVMYLGSVVELGSVADVFAPPFHPYTEALLSAVPVPDPDAQGARIILEGPLPSATEIPSGCPRGSSRETTGSCATFRGRSWRGFRGPASPRHLLLLDSEVGFGGPSGAAVDGQDVLWAGGEGNDQIHLRPEDRVAPGRGDGLGPGEGSVG